MLHYLDRGPTMLMSPTNTFNNCGNSSRLVLRTNLPNGVIRGSLSAVEKPPRLSALMTMLLNFHIRKIRPSLPTRCWPNKLGPASCSRMNAAVIKSNGIKIRSAISDNTISTSRLIKFHFRLVFHTSKPFVTKQ